MTLLACPIRIAGLAGALVCLLAAVAVLTVPVPAFEDIRRDPGASEATLLDRDGRLLQRLRLDQHRRQLGWTPLAHLAPALPKAVLAAEDRRFAWHPGVDPLGIVAALRDNAGRSRARGASTLTMQLAKLIGLAPKTRGLGGKLSQIRAALALELHWSKNQILEAYLNLAAFRGELVGVAAASHGLLDKGPDGLDEADAAILAALLRAPSASPQALARRACAVLSALDTHGRESPTCDRAAFIAAGLPRHPHAMPGTGAAPHLARRLLDHPGQVLHSTLSTELQRFASDTLRNRLSELRERNVEDGAVVVLDNRSGEVLAYVGSSGDLSGAAQVDGVSAHRQPGSTFKPFLYAVAIEGGWLDAASVLDDSPLALRTPSGLYMPQDYDREYRGAVSLRTALGASLNVPAVRTLTLIGVDRLLDRLHAAGLDSLDHDAQHYGYGLALGGAETDLLALSNAYRMLANGGWWSPPRLTLGPSAAPPGRRVFSPATSFVIADILADPAARAPGFGFASPLSARTWAAVKTGTSKGMRDNWAIGFSARYTVGVWVGNYSGAPMWEVSGVSGAAPVWRDIVEYLHAADPAPAPTAPPELVRATVVFHPPIEAPRDEWFAAGPGGAGPRHVHLDPPDNRPDIVAPPDGSILAPDPDIPQAQQSILVMARGAGCLRLDGRSIAACGSARFYVPLPGPGRHLLELTDAHGRVLAQAHFEVRGLVARRASGPS